MRQTPTSTTPKPTSAYLQRAQLPPEPPGRASKEINYRVRGCLSRARPKKQTKIGFVRPGTSTTQVEILPMGPLGKPVPMSLAGNPQTISQPSAPALSTPRPRITNSTRVGASDSLLKLVVLPPAPSFAILRIEPVRETTTMRASAKTNRETSTGWWEVAATAGFCRNTGSPQVEESTLPPTWSSGST